MILTIGSWFNEPGIEFKISHKVHKFIRQNIIEDIMKPFGLDDKDPNVYIGLVIATNSGITEVEVKGPEYDKRNSFINYGLWLPFKKIDSAKKYLDEYLKYLFDALVILFKKYEISEDVVRALQKKVEREVLNNDEYKYS